MVQYFKIAFYLSFLAMIGCGDKNLFKTNCQEYKELDCDESDPVEDVLILLDKKKPKEAIALAEEALEQAPTDYVLISVLASAIAELYEVDMISIGLAMANQSSSEGETKSNSITAMFSYLPPATDENINGLQDTVDLLNSIPDSVRTAADRFKIVLLNTALTSLRTKKFDADGDGVMSPVELQQVSIDDAVIILNALDAAISILEQGLASEGEGSTTAVANISEIRSSIDTADGDNDADRLKKFLNPDSISD